jgi:hypothetical protein
VGGRCSGSRGQPWAPLAAVGLAFFRDDRGGHLAIEHQGILPGFNSQIYLAPDDANDPYVFRIDLSRYDLGTVRVVFSGEAETMRVHLGGAVPLSAEKRPASRNPRLWATGAAGALAVATTAGVVRRLARERAG